MVSRWLHLSCAVDAVQVLGGRRIRGRNAPFFSRNANLPIGVLLRFASSLPSSAGSLKGTLCEFYASEISSLIPQRNHWIHARSALSWNHAGQCRDRQQHERRNRKSRRVKRLHFV